MKTVVLVPTYEEAENVLRLLEAIRRLEIPDLEVLVLDDGSPDGTAARVRGYARDHGFVDLIEREGPRGRGRALREGFLAALERGAERVIEMDADLSHDPRAIPELLAAAERCDLVLGSRFADGGRDRDRARARRLLTRVSSLYLRAMLGAPVRDPHSGFRCFRRRALEAIDPAGLRSPGHAMVQEVLFRAHRRGLRIGEVPVVFAERASGASKLGWGELWRGYRTPLGLRLRALLGREP